jgi:hypothetical protein
MENVVKGKILVGNVPWDSGYKNVVVWSDEEKSAYFENSEYFYDAGYTLDSVQPLLKGQCVLPIPWEQLSCCNYLVYYPEYPIADKQYDDNSGAKHGFDTPMYFFISNVFFNAPNATACDLMIDVWTTYSQYADMQSTYLERGHWECMELREKFASGQPVTLQDSPHFKDRLEDVNLPADRIVSEYVQDLAKLPRDYREVNRGIATAAALPIYQHRTSGSPDTGEFIEIAGEIGAQIDGAPAAPMALSPGNMVAVVYSIYNLIGDYTTPQLIVNDNFNVMSNIVPFVMSIEAFAAFWRQYNGTQFAEGIVDVQYVPNIGLCRNMQSQPVIWSGKTYLVAQGVWSFGYGANKGNEQYQSRASLNYQSQLRMTPYSFHMDFADVNPRFTTGIKTMFSPARYFVLSNRQGQSGRFALNDVYSDWNMNAPSGTYDQLRIRFDVSSRFEPGNGYLKITPRLGAPGRLLHQVTTTASTTYTDYSFPTLGSVTYNYPSNNDDIDVDTTWSNGTSKYACGYTYYGAGKDLALYYDAFPHVAITQETFSRWMVANKEKIYLTQDATKWSLDRTLSANRASYENSLAQMRASQTGFDASQAAMSRNSQLQQQNYRYYQDMQYNQGSTISRALAGGNVGKFGSNIFWNPSDVSQDLSYMQGQLSNTLSANQAGFSANLAASQEINNRNYNLSNMVANQDYHMAIRQLNTEVEAARFQPDATYGINKGSDAVSMGEFKLYLTEYAIGDKVAESASNKQWWYRRYLGKYGWRSDTWYSFHMPINLASDRMMCDRPGSVAYWKCQDVKLKTRAERPAGLNESALDTLRGILTMGVSVFDNPDNCVVELSLEELEK